ncbi:MAG TPA: glycerate kinase [Spirochaetota bacterium]|nr:glycerate kinase [Spirochaetota bacterium]HPI89113.1 glycerate kinase [Spirochaetota bacterium]HPR48867.1 glycerate kinase [Spirochaetota bacterium]
MPAPEQDLKAIYTAAIKAVDPHAAVKSHLRLDGDRLMLVEKGSTVMQYDLAGFKNIYVVGAGKATAPMAAAVESLLGNRISRGMICVKYGYTADLTIIETLEASHPVPDGNGVAASGGIMEILESAGADDLVISLISGGGSALLPYPASGITLEEKRKTTQLLLESGATIHEINALRKHLSRVKGGNMARAAFPATVINLMISDVVGDNMDVIASGPFVPDRSTFADALGVIDRYSLRERVPESVTGHLLKGTGGEIPENPAPGSDIFTRVTNSIVASNILACEAAKAEAEKRGYKTLILSSLIEGDTAATAFWHSRIAREIMQSGNPLPPPACIISGGETTVQVRGNGLGGRNMEYALQAAAYISGLDRVLMASIGTDGTDGPTDAAGAVAWGHTCEKAASQGLDPEDYMKNNDSYHFFEKIGGLIKTGPTNTNVMDIRIIMVWN